MKKAKWGNLFGTVLAGATIGTVMIVSKKITKNYGQDPRTQKMINTDVKGIINYGINSFLNLDDEKIDQALALIKE